MAQDDLILFTTELARRQYVRREALQKGFIDASQLLTLARLRDMLASAAREAGLLVTQTTNPVMNKVLARRAAGRMHGAPMGQGPLSALRPNALADTLENLVETLSSFGDDTEAVHELMKLPESGAKLNQLALLYETYRNLCAEHRLADIRDTNAAILALLANKKKETWPACLSKPEGRIILRGVRWLNPFEEKLVAALKRGLGKDRVVVHSALPPAHAEKVEDRLRARVRSEVLMGDDETWTAWTENLSDAIEVEDANVALDSRERLSFSRSAGLYGEIEDLARRIRWEMDACNVAPERIALIVRNLGDYADAVRHVFSRFGIRCHLRRGLPVLSAPLAKTYLSWLNLPLTLDRDTFCAILQTRSLLAHGFRDHDECDEIVHDILSGGVPPRLNAFTLRQSLETYYSVERKDVPKSIVDARIERLNRHLSRLRDRGRPAPFSAHADIALELMNDFALAESEQPGARANVRALEAIGSVIRSIKDSVASDNEPCSLREFSDLLEACIEDLTVNVGQANEDGVWVLNPFDAAGLQFDVVLICGLNEGVFPATTRQDSLFDDREREVIREGLKKKAVHLPLWALAPSTVQMVQESLLFLIGLGTAREHIVLSYQSCDTDGRDRVPSEFFRSVWNLAGWPSSPGISLGDYDAWRVKVAGNNCWVAQHFKRQKDLPPYQRMPMPGESYLATVPLPLCCATDEARQRIARAADDPALTAELARFRSSQATTPTPTPAARATVEGLDVERAREAFFSTPEKTRAATEAYCGRLRSSYGRGLAGDWLARHNELSPTALEVLAKCRYRFLLSKMCYIQELRTQEDTPDIMDRGRIIHRILELAYGALKGDTEPLAAIAPAITKDYADICTPRFWACRAPDDSWVLEAHSPRDGKKHAIPLCSFNAAPSKRYIAFAREVADAVFDEAEKSGELVRLGDPGIWMTEKPKIRQIITNYIALDIESAESERRFPALFELRFGRQFDRSGPDMPALALGDADDAIHVHGQVDRVDLIFDECGKLETLLVVDYKGPSRGMCNEVAYAEEIADNLDCQLPVYGFAAQQFFFNRNNTPELNAKTAAVYHIQDRNPDSMSRQFRKGRVRLNYLINEKQPLTTSFMNQLYANLDRLKDADFSVAPLDCTYCDFKHICRVDVNALAAAGGGDES